MESIVLRPERSSKDFKSGLKTSQEALTQAITQENQGFSLAGFVKERRIRPGWKSTTETIFIGSSSLVPTLVFIPASVPPDDFQLIV